MAFSATSWFGSSDGLHKETRLSRHLRSVHTLLLCGLGATAGGAWLHLTGYLAGGTFWTIAQVICLIALGVSQFGAASDVVKPWRLLTFLLFGFSAGVNVGTWIDYANAAAGLPPCDWANDRLVEGLSVSSLMDPSSLPTCTVMTGLVFVAFTLGAAVHACFLLAAVYAKPGTYAWVGAYVNMFFLALALAGFAHWLGLLGDYFMEFLYLQGALVAYSLNILSTSSKIALRADKGEPLDIVSDAVTMLGQLLNVTVRILVLLAKAFGKNKSKTSSKK